MTRKKRTSPAKDIMDLVAMLPWWVGIALAIVSYLLLHKIATTPLQVSAASGAGHVAALMPSVYLTALAQAGQYVIPILCIAGALISFVRKRKRNVLVMQVTESASAEALDGMSWREFELLVGEAFRQQGFRVAEKGGSAPDGGVDLMLRRDRETYLVQCKQWKAYKVGVDVVRELYGVMAASGAAGGFVVTSGTFTAEAKAFSDGRNIKLVDGSQLFALLRKVRATGKAVAPELATPDPQRAQHPRAPGATRRWYCAPQRKGRVLARGSGAAPHFPYAGAPNQIRQDANKEKLKSKSDFDYPRVSADLLLGSGAKLA